MSKSLNEAHLLGRAGKDAETRTTSGGKQLSKFSLATGGGKKKDGSGEWPTDWHNIECWNIAGAEDVCKGAEVEVWGRIQYDSREKNGERKYMTKIVATKIEVTGAQPSSKQPTNAHGADSTDADFDF